MESTHVICYEKPDFAFQERIKSLTLSHHEAPGMLMKWPPGRMNGPAQAPGDEPGRHDACRMLLGWGFSTRRPFSIARGPQSVTIAQRIEKEPPFHWEKA